LSLQIMEINSNITDGTKNKTKKDVNVLY